MNGLFDSSDLTPQVQGYIVRVYRDMLEAFGCAFIGVIASKILGWGSTIACIATFILIFVFMSAKNKEWPFRLIAFCIGFELGDMISFFIQYNPSVLMNALFATVVVFACFTVSALVNTSRSYLYLGGTLSSILIFIVFAPILGWFFPIFRSDSYLMIGIGLFCFSLYILYDTQLMIERAKMYGGIRRRPPNYGFGNFGGNGGGYDGGYDAGDWGDRGNQFGDDKYGGSQHYVDALNLFLDFVNLFIKMLQLMEKLDQKKNKKNK